MLSLRLDYSDRTGAILYGHSLFGEKAFQQKEKKQTIFLVIGVLKVNTELKQEMSQ